MLYRLITLLKKKAVAQMRKQYLHSLWAKLHKISLIGMNYWSSELHSTGEIYALKRAAIYRDCASSSVFIDVGANVGEFILAAYDILRPGYLVAFEPSPEARSQLVDRINRRGIQNSVRVEKYALSDKKSQTNLYSSFPGASTASLHIMRRNHDQKPLDITEIETLTLDSYCESQNIAEIYYLKVDAEGHDFAVLKGASALISSKKIKYIQFEFGFPNIESRTYVRDFYDLLSPNYEIFKIIPDALIRIERYDPELEIFATINFFAELRI